MRQRQRQRSRQTIVGAAAIPGILPVTSNIAFAIGGVKLISSYSGYCVKIRRSSDSATLDVGFTATGQVDTEAITAFIGGGSGYVHTFYDQSGNGRNVSQITAARQPAANLSNSSFGSKFTADFTAGSTHYMQSDPWGVTVADPNTLYAVYSNTVTAAVTIEMTDPVTATGTRVSFQDTGAGGTKDPAVFMGSSYLTYTDGGNGPFVSCAVNNGATDSWWVNDKTTARATGSSGVGNMNGVTLGRYITGGYYTTGSLRAVVAFSGAASTGDRQSVMQALADDSGITIA